MTIPRKSSPLGLNWYFFCLSRAAHCLLVAAKQEDKGKFAWVRDLAKGKRMGARECESEKRSAC
jgi:hypothetical protein